MKCSDQTHLFGLFTLIVLYLKGHNSDGKFIARAQRIEFDCELIPRRVAIFIEKTKDGQVLPVPNVVARDVACGANHTVCSKFVDCSVSQTWMNY